MTAAHRTAAVLTEDGKLLLDRLPFRAGEAVEVIVRASPAPAEVRPTLPLPLPVAEVIPHEEFVRRIHAMGTDCGVSLSDQALGREEMYD